MRIQKLNKGKSDKGWSVHVDGEEVAKGLTREQADAKAREIAKGA